MTNAIRKLERSVIILLATLLSVVGCSRHDTRFCAGRDLKEVRLPIQGMVCGACVANVKRGLKSMDGVEEVEVSLEKREARIRYDPWRIAPEKFASTVKNLGYTPGESAEASE